MRNKGLAIALVVILLLSAIATSRNFVVFGALQEGVYSVDDILAHDFYDIPRKHPTTYEEALAYYAEFKTTAKVNGRTGWSLKLYACNRNLPPEEVDGQLTYWRLFDDINTSDSGRDKVYSLVEYKDEILAELKKKYGAGDAQAIYEEALKIPNLSLQYQENSKRANEQDFPNGTYQQLNPNCQTGDNGFWYNDQDFKLRFEFEYSKLSPELHIDPPSQVIKVGDMAQYTAKYVDEAGEVSTITDTGSWSQGFSGVVQGQGKGKFKGLSEGVNTVAVQYKGLTAYADIQVTDSLPTPQFEQGLVVTPPDQTVSVGENATYKAMYTDTYGNTSDVTNLASWMPVINGMGGAYQVTKGVFKGSSVGGLKVEATYNGLMARADMTVIAGNINIRPVAIITSDTQLEVGETFCIKSDSYDEDGWIESHSWYASGIRNTNDNWEGFTETTTFECGFYYTSVGKKYIDLSVHDNDGLLGMARHEITVTPPVPRADFTIGGYLKENRRVTLTPDEDIYRGDITVNQYPIVEHWWKIEPLEGVASSDLKTVQTISSLNYTNYDTVIELLSKKKGKYRVTRYMKNTVGTSDTVVQELVIGEDKKPIADFSTSNLEYRDANKKATITATDTSYSEDDSIGKRIWYITYDSDNDGSFTDETRELWGNQNKTSVSKPVYKVGKYLIELEVWESFVEETIPQFVDLTENKATSDRRYNDTSSKQLSQKIVNVDNLAPIASFKAAPVRNVNLQFASITSPFTRQQLNSALPYLQQQLAMDNIKANVSITESEEVVQVVAGGVGGYVYDYGYVNSYFELRDGNLYPTDTTTRNKLGYRVALPDKVANYCSAYAGKFFVLSADGSIFMMGASHVNYEMGYYVDLKKIYTPTNGKKAKTIKCISELIGSGTYAVALDALLENGKVIRFGYTASSYFDTNYIELAIPSKVVAMPHSRVYHAEDGKTYHNMFEAYAGINVTSNNYNNIGVMTSVPDGVRFKETDDKTGVNSPSATYFIAEDGRLYCFSTNGYSRCPNNQSGNYNYGSGVVNFTSHINSQKVSAYVYRHFSVGSGSSDYYYVIFLENGEVYVHGRLDRYSEFMTQDKVMEFSNAPSNLYNISPANAIRVNLKHNGVTLTNVKYKDGYIYASNFPGIKFNFSGGHYPEYYNNAPTWFEVPIDYVTPIIDNGTSIPSFTTVISNKSFLTTRIRADLKAITTNTLGYGTSESSASFAEVTSDVPRSEYRTLPANNNMQTFYADLASRIKAIINNQYGTSALYLILDELVAYNPSSNDSEGDPIVKSRWKFTHNPDYYANSMGLDPLSNQYIDDPITQFSKVGHYKPIYSVQDNPLENIGNTTAIKNAFSAYPKWSAEVAPLNIYVHRKPVPEFSYTLNVNTGDYTVTNKAYDLDSDSTASGKGKGIKTQNWKWRFAGETTWRNNLPTSPLTLTKVYEIKNTVVDYQNREESLIKELSGVAQPPTAVFEPLPPQIYKGSTVKLENMSSDPNGQDMGAKWEYKLLGSTTQWATHSSDGYYVGSSQWGNANWSPTTGVFNQVGVYEVRLTVWDGDGMTDSMTKTVTVLEIPNSPPVANFTTNKTSYAYSETATLTNTSTDPDNDVMTAKWYVKLKSQADTSYTQFSTGTSNNTSTTKWHTTLKQSDLPASIRCLTLTTGTCEYTIKLVVSDSLYESSTTKNISFVNTPPTACMQIPTPNYIGDSKTIINCATDPDGQSLTFNYEVTKPNGSKVTYNWGNPIIRPNGDLNVSFMVHPTDLGTWTIKQTVSDGHATSSITGVLLVLDQTVQGTVSHTPKWLQNIQKFNSLYPAKAFNLNQALGYIEFFKGERFVLDATDTGLATKVDVAIQGYAPYKTALVKNTGNNWNNSLWSNNMFYTFKNGDILTFNFKATFQNGWVSEDNVRIRIRDEDYWTQHLSY